MDSYRINLYGAITAMTYTTAAIQAICASLSGATFALLQPGDASVPVQQHDDGELPELHHQQEPQQRHAEDRRR